MTKFIESVIDEYLIDHHELWLAYKSDSYSFISIESDYYGAWIIITPEESTMSIFGSINKDTTGQSICRHYTPHNMLDVITQCILEIESERTD